MGFGVKNVNTVGLGASLLEITVMIVVTRPGRTYRSLIALVIDVIDG